MTTLAHRSALRGRRNGGVAARRALVRWAWRMFRREWRQQILVVALLTVAVAAAIGSITLAYNSGPADDSDFGSANLLLMFDGSDPRKLQAGLGSAKKSFGTIDVIGHRSVPVPGSVETVDYRSQIPDGAYGGELLALRRGSYPVGPARSPSPTGWRSLFGSRSGQTLALDGRRRTVVGIVENPSELSDEFALVSPSSASPDQVDVLVDASAGRHRPTPSSNPLTTATAPARPSRAPWLAETTSAVRQRRWRCSPSPPSSSSLPRWLPPQASQSSRSDGSASSACSLPSAPRRSTSVSCC